MIQECLFCRITNNELPSEKIFENDSVLGFKDINPIAPIHLIFIHKRHSTNICSLIEKDILQIPEIFKALNQFISTSSLKENGFRIIINSGDDGGQTIFHTHIHLIGGKKLSMKC